jgi:hypothetical protein
VRGAPRTRCMTFSATTRSTINANSFRIRELRVNGF